MSIAIVKYNAGNIRSVDYALRRIGVEPIITADEKILLSADKVIFPGVGEAATVMDHLCTTGLDELIARLRQPVLGICIGMQLMCRNSEEGNARCLGIFDVDVKRFVPQRSEDKVPHIGWNELEHNGTGLFTGIPAGAFVYFVHSYYAPVNPCTVATTDYILPFSAAMQHDNYFATQFHPEKSGAVGERILQNFLEL